MRNLCLARDHGVGAPQFIPALNGMRAVAALAVLGQHASENNLLPEAFRKASTGQLGVMLFFCLSGLLMAELFVRQDATWASLWNFVRSRFARIFPLFATVVVGSALISHFDTRFPFQLDGVAATKHLLLLGDGRTMWSISVEFQFYAAFVGLWLLYAAALPERHRNSGLALVCSGLVLALWIAGYPGGRIAITHYAQFFLVGVLAAIVLWHAPASAIARTASFVLPILLALDVLVAANLGLSDYALYRSLPLLTLTGIIILYGAAGQGFFAERVLGSQTMVYLGEMSFGVYLLHRPVMYFWQTLIGLNLHWTAMFPIVMATLLAASHFAYRWLEQPARRVLSGNRAASRAGALAKAQSASARAAFPAASGAHGFVSELPVPGR